MKQPRSLESSSSILVILSIVVSKMCCILPLVGFAFGGGILFHSIEIISPFMMMGSLVLISYAWYKFLKVDTCSCRNRSQKRLMLSISSALLILLFFFQILLPISYKLAGQGVDVSSKTMTICH